MSYNVQGMVKHLWTIADLLDSYQPHLVMLQETKMHKLEETSTDNKLGSERKFYLNADDQYETDFGDRIAANSKQAHHGTGTIVNIEVVGKNFIVSEPVTARLQHIRMNGINYVNAYLPTRDESELGRAKLTESLADLDAILEPLKGETIIIAGDLNVGKLHGPWRREQFRSLFTKHDLTLFSPKTPTNFPRGGGAPQALDHLVCTSDVSVLYKE